MTKNKQKHTKQCYMFVLQTYKQNFKMFSRILFKKCGVCNMILFVLCIVNVQY